MWAVIRNRRARAAALGVALVMGGAGAARAQGIEAADAAGREASAASAAAPAEPARGGALEAGRGADGPPASSDSGAASGAAGVEAGASAPVAGAADPHQVIPYGSATSRAELDGMTLPVWTYRPANCAPRMLMLVFHGVSRNPADYRDHAKPLADKVCAVVVAPLFDKDRFPRDAYQYGGMRAGQDEGSASLALVPPLADWARRAAGQPTLPLVLLGHSAGAQFLDRVAAYSQSGAARIVIANPSTWVMARATDDVPFGFGGLGWRRNQEEAMRAYLGQPITILLGMDDVHAHLLAKEKEAVAQGPNRFARGLNAYHSAQAMARSKGWAFEWRLLEVPGVGHDAARMFASPQAERALSGVR
ncbi:hypothetical protein Bsp3421_004346 [Burkholderia sp. FERM BP-3421]|uniref:hypothetical protein n=1 Tax=Burkholderia sp. FERM BP-3421 TaxID=1494466 RepID=UPI00235F59A5|nr:hypothetical protein [Burkholderia sp. FERM BP-3421]WDD94232.1 hypothetical protein Bsp3421_004346 [Burkholderia sp. FERM BP-3421]